MTPDPHRLLQVSNLTVQFGHTPVVRDVSFEVARGETVCIVGESGSGKSISALSIPGLLPALAHVSGGRILFEGTDLLTAEPAALRSLRGRRLSMIFQEPLSALNPVHTIARQTAECLHVHNPQLSPEAVMQRVQNTFARVGLPRLDSIGQSYPHQISGGQRQRVMIAMALINEPDLLIADEPTTALDVTVQRQILDLIQDLARESQMGVIFITHDLGVVRHMADRVAVMHEGRLVEWTAANTLFTAPKAPYTQHLMRTRPHGTPAPVLAPAKPVLSAKNLKVHFPIKQGVLRRTVDYVRAVDDLSLSIHAGETVGLVGESGSGKSTVGLALLSLVAFKGAVHILGQDVQSLNKKQKRALRADVQVVFQDPFGSLSPRLTVADIVGEGLAVHQPDLSRAERDLLIDRHLQEVGLQTEMRHRYPHEFSGGQRQRIAIARAMILRPKILILDEPTSALDVSVQADVIALLRGLQEKYQVAYIFISHDMTVVRAMAHRILVMRDGRVVEEGPAADILDTPQAAYTQDLIKAVLPIPALPATTTAFHE